MKSYFKGLAAEFGKLLLFHTVAITVGSGLVVGGYLGLCLLQLVTRK